MWKDPSGWRTPLECAFRVRERVMACSVQSENGEQSGVDAPLLFRAEMAGEVTEAMDVDCSDLLDEHPRRGAIDIDFGAEGCRSGAGRRGSDQHDRPREEGVGLHDDTESTSSLLMSHPPGEPEGEDVTPTHGGSP